MLNELYNAINFVKNRYGSDICKKLDNYCTENGKSIISVVTDNVAFARFVDWTYSKF